jgi:aldehyde dehydrogenase (NAD+)
VTSHQSSYIAGKWATDGEPFAVENPADESHVADVASASPAEAARAIAEARRSFDSGVWADLPAADRARVLHEFLDHIEAAAPALIDTIVAEAGQPVFFAERTQVGSGLALARETITLYLSLRHEEVNQAPVDQLLAGGGVTLSTLRYEPVGVVAAITPYNAAFMMAMQKIIPALLAGNSVIVRPSPLTPLSSLILGTAADAAGLPPGVLSVLVESGAAGAELLSTHPAVDMVSFTGSTAVGRLILAQAAPTIKRVGLELGGKSAQIYLEDAVDRAARGATMVVAATAGQACVAATRMLVPSDRKDEVIEAVAQVYAGIKVGSPTDPSTLMGPVISAGQRARCEQYVAAATEHGGRVAFGGTRPDGLDHGYYFQPTVLDVPGNDNPAARDEIFGPVLSVIGYRDVDDAVRIANDSEYGLSAQVYSADLAAAVAVARRLRTGAVNVNSGFFSAYAPGGGYKQSGLGRERGVAGIREFQEVKHIAIGALT